MADPIDTKLKMISMPVGVILRRQPGVTRWAKWAWKAVSVLPGAGPAHWKEMRKEGEAMTPPSLFVVLRPDEADGPYEMSVHAITASAYEAQDYLDSGEELVEPVPMPDGLIAWVRDFTDAHFKDEPFIKRKRDKKRIDLSEDGIGDVRIRQVADIYRAPGAAKPKKDLLH